MSFVIKWNGSAEMVMPMRQNFTEEQLRTGEQGLMALTFCFYILSHSSRSNHANDLRVE